MLFNIAESVASTACSAERRCCTDVTRCDAVTGRRDVIRVDLIGDVLCWYELVTGSVDLMAELATGLTGAAVVTAAVSILSDERNGET